MLWTVFISYSKWHHVNRKKKPRPFLSSNKPIVSELHQPISLLYWNLKWQRNYIIYFCTKKSFTLCLFFFTKTCNMLLEIYWHTKMPRHHGKICVTPEIFCNATLFLLTDHSLLLYALHNRLFSAQCLGLSLQWCMFLHLSYIFCWL